MGERQKRIPLWDSLIHILGQKKNCNFAQKENTHPCHLLLFEIQIEMLKIKQKKTLNFF
jgi:hypothetical protein